jgi:hypothetical protein
VPLARKIIRVAIQLASNQTNQPQNFAESGTNTVTLDGHRASVRVQNSGAAAGSAAQVAVWGMTPSLMDQLSTLGMVVQMIPRNTITITAGEETQDGSNNTSTVFVGTILQAYGDFNNAPDVPFRLECLAGAAEQAIPFPASSYTGGTDVSTILSAIASKMGWGFENNGVNVQLANPYLSGSAIDQVRSVAEHAHINASLINNVLCIWPRFGSRKASGIPLIAPAPAGQMIGYPTYTQQGILVRTIFDPRIAFGGQIQVQSSLKKASGTWNVFKLDLKLDSLLPKGLWEQEIYAYNPNFPSPIPPQAS